MPQEHRAVETADEDQGPAIASPIAPTSLQEPDVSGSIAVPVASAGASTSNPLLPVSNRPMPARLARPSREQGELDGTLGTVLDRSGNEVGREVPVRILQDAEDVAH